MSLLEYFLSGKSLLDLGWVTVMVLSTFWISSTKEIMKEKSDRLTVMFCAVVCDPVQCLLGSVIS